MRSNEKPGMLRSTGNFDENGGLLRNRSRFRQLSRWVAWFILSFTITIQPACATNPKLTNHSFSFDAVWDSPDIVILDYRYGNSAMTHAKEWQKQEAYLDTIQGGGVNGPMLRGDDLYVRWRIKSTGKVYEDTVDLKNRLPDDIGNHRIHFIVHGPQLHVYLISPKRRDGCPEGFSDEARACIQKAVAANGGAVVGCPSSREELRRMKNTHTPDEMIYSAYCYLKISRLYPGKPEPLNIKVE